MDVSIIIVNYNTKELLDDCLNSIINHTFDLKYEILVSDNASKDGSVEMISKKYPSVIVISNENNLGFGKANNVALKYAQGKYIFYLNSDTVLLNNAVKFFFDYWEKNEHVNIGALGANLFNSDMSIGHSFASFPTFNSEFKFLLRQNLSFFCKTLFKILHINYKRFLKPRSHFEKYIGNVDYITGADLFVKNNDLAEFNEDYFMYFEETSLQKKMEMLHLQRIIIDGPQIIHYGGGSNKYIDDFYYVLSNSHQFYCNSRIIFINEFYGEFWSLIIKILTKILFMNPFFILKKLKEKFKGVL